MQHFLRSRWVAHFCTAPNSTFCKIIGIFKFSWIHFGQHLPNTLSTFWHIYHTFLYLYNIFFALSQNSHFEAWDSSFQVTPAAACKKFIFVFSNKSVNVNDEVLLFEGPRALFAIFLTFLEARAAAGSCRHIRTLVDAVRIPKPGDTNSN